MTPATSRKEHFVTKKIANTLPKKKLRNMLKKKKEHDRQILTNKYSKNTAWKFVLSK